MHSKYPLQGNAELDFVEGNVHYNNVFIQAVPDEVFKGHVYLYISVCPDVNIVLKIDCVV